ncbi:MAG: hypothetical protein H3C49_03655 [Alphaproteobacteria bacterium]|nr:hypothetical protein [Alphaproteobacteria bacterium]
MSRRLPALERNILKYRALEMVIILFYAEHIKNFAYNSLKATSRLNGRELPEKKKYEKTWEILVNDEIINEEESKEIQSLINYRNDIGHRIVDLTYDLSNSPYAQSYKELHGIKYDYNARIRLKYFSEELPKRMRGKYIQSLSMKPLLFEAAEKTYDEELLRLGNKIARQYRKSFNNK